MVEECSGPASKTQKSGEAKVNEYQLEADVGITEYMRQGKPTFFGIIKQRYSDFLVNEIDMEGNVVHLTDLSVLEWTGGSRGNSDVSVTREDVITIIGAEAVDRIESLEEQASKLIIDPVEDKDQRSKVHQYIKEKFPHLNSVTDDKKKIVLSFTSKKKQNSRDNDDSRNSPPFTGFYLYKENKDTYDALQKLSRVIGVHISLFKFAGMKDKRGITCQRVVAKRISASKIAKINSIENRGIKVGNFTFPKHLIGLGDLKGNRFTIVLRDVKIFDEEEMKVSMEALKSNGFINYFGMQRFGTGSLPTQLVGLKALQGKWEEAVTLILEEHSSDGADLAQAKKYWKLQQPLEVCLASLPGYCVAEKHLMKALSKNPKDYIGAFNYIPRSLRQIYLHAFQSYVWNLAASKRITKYGNSNAVVGDLVCVDKSDEVKADRKMIVKLVETEEEASQYSIFEIVLPLPGLNSIYPSNELGAFYEEILLKNGVDMSKSNEGPLKDFNLSGDYRFVVAKPENVEYSVKSYTNHEIQLVPTDLDILMGENNSKEDKDEIQSNDEKLAIVVSFNLKPSSYATMVLRELMKTETGKNSLCNQNTSAQEQQITKHEIP